MTLRARLLFALLTFLILRHFFSTPDAALLAVVVLLTVTLAAFNLNSATQHNEITARVQTYLALYFEERRRGASVDDAVYEVAKSRYPLSYGKVVLILNSLEEMNPPSCDEKVKHLIRLMYMYEEPAPPTPEMLDRIGWVVGDTYITLKREQEWQAQRTKAS